MFPLSRFLSLGALTLSLFAVAPSSFAQSLGDSAIITDGSDVIAPDTKAEKSDDVVVITVTGLGRATLMTHAVPDGGSAAFDDGGTVKGKMWDLHLKLRRDNERYVVFGVLFVGEAKPGSRPAPIPIVDVIDLSEKDALIKIKDTAVSIKITRLQDKKAEEAGE